MLDRSSYENCGPSRQLLLSCDFPMWHIKLESSIMMVLSINVYSHWTDCTFDVWESTTTYLWYQKRLLTGCSIVVMPSCSVEKLDPALA